MSCTGAFWYRDDDGSLYDTDCKRALNLYDFVCDYPDLNSECDPSGWTYIHDTSGRFQFDPAMVRRPFSAYLILYDRYKQLTNQNEISDKDKKLIKRHKNVMDEINYTFNMLGNVIPELTRMDVDNDFKLINEDDVRRSVRYIEELYSDGFFRARD